MKENTNEVFITRNYLGLVHDNVARTLNTELEFVTDISIKVALAEEYPARPMPAAVYQDLRANPEKKFVIILLHQNSFTIIRKSEEEMKPLWLHSGIKCLKCNEVLVSLTSQDKNQCKCENKASVIGEGLRLKYSAKNIKEVQLVRAHLKLKLSIPISQLSDSNSGKARYHE